MRLSSRIRRWIGPAAAACGLIVPVLIAVPAATAATVAPAGGPPAGLASVPVNLTDNNGLRYGEPEIAVNPSDPDNVVYYVMSQQLTYACEAAKQPNCINDPLNGSAVGEYTTPGWISTHVYVTFDRGRSWHDETSDLNQNSLPAPTEVTDSTGTHLVSHDDLLSRGDPMVTVTADGTFYIGWDAMHLGTIYLPPGYSFGGRVICPANGPQCPIHGLVDGGIAVSKSVNGGRTWSTPTLTGTGVDRPWMTTDLSTGTVYEASSGGIRSAMSTGDSLLPTAAPGVTPDRYVVSSPDGVHWTQPEPLGGGGFSAASGSTISAARGLLTAAFQEDDGNDAACQYFLASTTAKAPCTVFETSTDSGAHWSRHAVPGLADASGSILVAADPAKPGTYTVASTDPTTTKVLSYVTHDSGAHWSGPAVLDDGSQYCPPATETACKFKLWMAYSPDGTLGLAWRSANVNSPASATATADSTGTATVLSDGAAILTSASVSTAAAADPPPCDLLGCGVAPPDDPNDEDPAAVPYTMWAAVSQNAGRTFSRPLEVSPGASAAADPNMLTGTDDTSVIALSDHTAYVGWGQWPTGTDQQGNPLNVQGFLATVKLSAFGPVG